MNGRERYSVSNENPFDWNNCTSDEQSDRREQEYDDVDGPNSRPNPNRSSTPDSYSDDDSVRAMNSVLSKAKRVSEVIKRKSNNVGKSNERISVVIEGMELKLTVFRRARKHRRKPKKMPQQEENRPKKK